MACTWKFVLTCLLILLMEGARLAGCAVLRSCDDSVLVAAVGIALQLKFPMYGRSLRLWQQWGVSYVGKPGAVTEWRRQKAAANVYRPADRVTYIHNPNKREMPTFPCKLALHDHIDLFQSMLVISAAHAKQIVILVLSRWGRVAAQSSFQNEITGKCSHTEPETGRSQHCEKRKCIKFIYDDGVQ